MELHILVILDPLNSPIEKRPCGNRGILDTLLTRSLHEIYVELMLCREGWDFLARNLLAGISAEFTGDEPANSCFDCRIEDDFLHIDNKWVDGANDGVLVVQEVDEGVMVEFVSHDLDALREDGCVCLLVASED